MLKLKLLEAGEARVWLTNPTCRVVMDPSPYTDVNIRWVGLAVVEDPDIQPFEKEPEHQWRIALPLDGDQMRLLESVRDGGDLRIGLTLSGMGIHLEDSRSGQPEAVHVYSEENQHSGIIPARIPSSDWERYREHLGCPLPASSQNMRGWFKNLVTLPWTLIAKFGEWLWHIVHRVFS